MYEIVIILIAVVIFLYPRKKLIYVYRTDCPHCVKFAGEWAILSNQLNTDSYSLDEAQSMGMQVPYVPYIAKKTTYGIFNSTIPYTGQNTALEISKWF